MLEKIVILGVKIDDIGLDQTLLEIKRALVNRSQITVFTPNPEICLKAESDEHYREVLNFGSINIPDGVGLKYGAKILSQTLKNKTCGSDLTKEILSSLKPSKVYIISRRDALSQKADLYNLFKNKFPDTKFKVGFLDKAKPFDCDNIINEINVFEPQILFVCLGAPNQEIWISKFLKFLPCVNAALAVGCSFDFLTGKIKRAPEMMRNFGLEWLYRLYQEPQRLNRIKNATVIFLLKCLHWKERLKKEYRENVLGVVVNSQNKFLIQKNKHLNNHWQFPQGGVDAGESEEAAVIREVSEEVGIDKKHLQIIKKLKATNTYDWPPHSQILKGYKGQKQNAFLIKFTGSNTDLNFQKSHEVEAIEWVDKNEVVSRLHQVRKDFAKKLLNEI